MKKPTDIVAAIGRRLESTWAQSLTGEIDEPAWPHRFPLSSGSSRSINDDFEAVVNTVADWREWAREHDLELVERGRRIGVVTHSIPSHVVVSTLDAAARIGGATWVQRLARGRGRVAAIRGRFGDIPELAKTLRTADKFDDVEFELLLQAGAWFQENTADGLTPRQVPLEGFHAKWLNTRQHLVAQLAGKEDLGLVRNHPPRIHFTYLDPDHRACGGRRHDSATVGDDFLPAYMPSVVIISENKDTAINFPEVPGGISVEGVGRGGGTIASFPWLVHAPDVVYWGDMDADGLEILDGFRSAGVPARSILMDHEAFARYERYGTNVDKRGAPLTSRSPRPVPHLTDDERALYLDLVSQSWSVRRIEQERIPLEVAREAVSPLANMLRS